MCEKHWGEFCDIELPEDSTLKDCIAYERKKLRFTERCGYRPATKGLKQMQEDLDNYVFRHVSIRGGEEVTVAEYRAYQEAKEAKEAEGQADADDHEAAVECFRDKGENVADLDDAARQRDDEEDDDDDFFGEF